MSTVALQEVLAGLDFAPEAITLEADPQHEYAQSPVPAEAAAGHLAITEVAEVVEPTEPTPRYAGDPMNGYSISYGYDEQGNITSVVEYDPRTGFNNKLYELRVSEKVTTEINQLDGRNEIRTTYHQPGHIGDATVVEPYSGPNGYVGQAPNIYRG